MKDKSDVAILRELAREYAEIAASPAQEERRKLWFEQNSLRPTRLPVLATYGMWNVWCREVFADAAMKCQEAFYREYERTLRMWIFQASVGDDTVLEPWITVAAKQSRGYGQWWGVQLKNSGKVEEGGSWKFTAPLVEWSDMARLSPPPHELDEAATAQNAARLGEAIGDLLTINVERGPLCQGFISDLSYGVTQLRGLEQLMIDMYESPKELHNLMAFLRDGVLANQRAAEAAGDMGATSQQNQCHTYADETVRPAANRRGLKRRQLWSYMAAQEFELISPAMHEEFLLQYQLPIMQEWGLAAYGCCENLTRKIEMLRKVPNLRIIAVTPRADVRRCAEQIGRDYVMSWRPNPADMVCCQFDEKMIRRIIREGLEASRGGIVHVHLKDVETVQGEPDRLRRWVKIVREVAEEVGQ
jgi:hypothetical protein